MKYAYIRVSTKDQNLDRQWEAIKGLDEDEVFADKQSGKDFDRPEYQKMLEKLEKKGWSLQSEMDEEEWAEIVYRKAQILTRLQEETR